MRTPVSDLVSSQSRGIIARDWPSGDPVVGGGRWLVEQVANGVLPDIAYRWVDLAIAEEGERVGEYVKVELVDVRRKLRHLVQLSERTPLVLTARRVDWQKASSDMERPDVRRQATR